MGKATEAAAAARRGQKAAKLSAGAAARSSKRSAAVPPAENSNGALMKRPRKHQQQQQKPASMLDAYGRNFMKMFDDYKEEREPTSPGEDDSAESSATSSGDEDSDQREPSGASAGLELAQIFGGEKKAKPVSARAGSMQAKAAGANVVTFVDTTRADTAHASKKQLALERRRFMSCKVGKIHTGVEAEVPTEEATKEIDFLSPEAFDQMRQEAQELGAAALDKKAKKAFEEKKLLQLGAKAEKAPRVAAMIGKGMAKKQGERAQRALEEAINTGMVKQKGLGKKKRMAQSREHGKIRSGENDGLGGRFKDGILHVSKPAPRKDKLRKGSLLKGIKL